MSISVIIATRDRAPLLAATLEAVCRQETSEDVEVVIVDNGSIDATGDVVADFARGSKTDVVYVREDRAGKSHALNTGVAHARGDVLVFTDDDVVPAGGWLKTLVTSLLEAEVDFATGRILPLWESSPPQWFSPALHGALSVADAGTERLKLSQVSNGHIMPLGGNLAIRRRVIDRIGGWNPELGSLQGTLRTGEDHEFGLRMIAAGFVGIYEPRAMVRHRVPPERLRPRYFLRWYHTNGAVDATLEQTHPTTSRYVLNVPRYLWRQLVADALGVLGGVAIGDARRAMAGAMRVAWFGGYARARWSRPVRGPRAAASPVVFPRS